MILLTGHKKEKVKIYEPQKEKIQRIQLQIMILNRVLTAWMKQGREWFPALLFSTVPAIHHHPWLRLRSLLCPWRLPFPSPAERRGALLLWSGRSAGWFRPLSLHTYQIIAVRVTVPQALSCNRCHQSAGRSLFSAFPARELPECFCSADLLPRWSISLNILCLNPEARRIIYRIYCLVDKNPVKIYEQSEEKSLQSADEL